MRSFHPSNREFINHYKHFIFGIHGNIINKILNTFKCNYVKHNILLSYNKKLNILIIMESEKVDKKPEDARFDFLANYTLKSLRLKPEKWSKLISNEENCAIVTKFLDDKNEKVLAVSLSVTLQLVPYLGFPATVKSKGVYFVRRLKQIATDDNMALIFAWGDLAPRISEQLGALIDTVSNYYFMSLIN